MAIILNFLDLDLTAPINCQVGSASYSHVTSSDRDDYKIWITSELVGTI